jgi:PAS domain S-box-containing protein
MDVKDYIKIFEQSSGLVLVIDTSFIIVAASDDFIKKTKTTRENIIGRHIFDVFPFNTEDKTNNGESKIRTSFNRVIKNKTADTLPIVRYDIPKPESEGGGFEAKYWKIVNSPILDTNNNVKYIIQRSDDVTENETIAAQLEAEQKALKQIEDSEKRYNLMLMKSPFAFAVLKGKNMVITLANDSVKEMWGKGKNLEGKSLLEVLPEIKDSEFPDLLDKVYTTGTPFCGDEVLCPVFRNGKLEDVYFNFVYQPYLEADETISGISIIAYEVTAAVIVKNALAALHDADQKALKKIEESERNLRQVLDTMPQKITNADTDGNVIYFNKKWLDDTGLEFEKLKGWGWEKVIHPDDLEMTKINWNNSFKTGEIFDMECRIINKEGAYKWHLSRALPIKDENGKIKMWVGTNTDIHEQKDAKYKAETAQLAAEDAMQAKQQFLSNMSHEIRTPMNAIIGFTNVVLKSKLEKIQEEYLMAIKVSGDALLVLINDILDLAKVDAGKMTYEQTPFNLATSLSAMLQLFDIKLKEKNLELEEQFDKAIPKIIMGDPMRLRQIILNLISNAVKFTEVGKITMCVALIEQDAEKITIEFTVTDTGIGIHKNKLEHIFDDFGQATYENSRLYGGTGLGLTIVKKLIEQQDGTIHVESELGKGSAFSFQLSFAKTNQKIKHETEQVSNKQVDIKNITVLVAEDMPLNQLLIKIILADFGFEVDIADNGKIAIEKLQQKKYDLVLMDLQMPEMNGFDATDYVRKTMKSNIPIIALTADVTSIDVEKALSVGMNDYISKPIDEQLLYSKIIKVLQKTE